MKNSLIAISLLISACQKPVEIKTIAKLNLQPVAKSQVTTSKRFANPVLIEGSDFLSFFAMMRMAYPGKVDTLLLFTSHQSKIHHTRQSILKLYEKTNLNFQKKLKAINKVNGTLYILNYKANKFATRTLVTCSVSIENDTAKMILPNDLKEFLR